MAMRNPGEIADAGEKIYKEKYKEDFEERFRGKFVAIDVLNEEAYVEEYAEKALEKAREEAPYGVFHLIRIGADSASRVSYLVNATPTDWSWALQRAG